MLKMSEDHANFAYDMLSAPLLDESMLCERNEREYICSVSSDVMSLNLRKETDDSHS
jgi:hypothetical protein